MRAVDHLSSPARSTIIDGSTHSPGRVYYGWIVVAAAALSLTFTAGARLLPGIVLKDVTTEFGWTRSELMLAITINMIVLSIMQPFTGAMTDRFGPRNTLVAGILSIGAMMLTLSFANQLWHFYVIYGFFGAFGLAAVSPVNVTSLVSGWFLEKRGIALSISTSGTAFGQLLVVPIATWVLTMTEWPALYRGMAAVLLVVVMPMALLFIKPADGDDSKASADTASGEVTAQPATLREALAGNPFWLLAFGFFVCGFTMAFANTHFIAYADDMGMSTTFAAQLIAVTAVFSIIGSFALGWAADRHPRQRVLSLTYFLRGFAFVLLMLLPLGTPDLIYAAVLGISWTATTPLTAAISADIYGRRHLGIIFGTMFSFMNIGFGAGSFLDGLAYDLYGTYRGALIVNAALGLLAAIAVLGVSTARPDRSRSPHVADSPRPVPAAD